MLRIAVNKKKLIDINRTNRLLSVYPESWKKLASKELGESKVYLL